MAWHAYKVVYETKSPIHIGYRTLGFIQRTRYYITGRVLWGAITANITRAYFLSALTNNVATIYDNVGKAVSKHIKLSYLYPALKPEEPLLPRFTSQGLKFGSFAQDSFEATFVGSFGQTAIDPNSNTAEEGSIHETEFISPAVESADGPQRVFFVGYIILNEEEKILGQTLKWDGREFSLKDAIKEIFVGGERKYGFGRLVLKEDKTERLKPDNDTLFGHKLVMNGRVALQLDADSAIPAHLKIDGCSNLKGDIEPLVGREWGEINSDTGKKAGAGQKVTGATLCWVPGSLMLKGKTLNVGEYGVLTVNP